MEAWEAWTFAKITSRNRLERKLINPVALREAFINSVVHNDYNRGWPVVEFYSDRVTITSTGGLVEGLSQEDFFKGALDCFAAHCWQARLTGVSEK
ncbi:MAG: hypothetical protein LBL37_06920 [Gracilibacteraceae bacterium]|jgi:predicted HTH transcriptional regulator|nr:hypothetical protein [Gracilibacteraceae bacterium]